MNSPALNVDTTAGSYVYGNNAHRTILNSCFNRQGEVDL